MRSEPITVEAIDYHRNGVSGEGFHVVLFTSHQRLEDDKKMVAVLFELEQDADGKDALDRGEFYNCPTAVLNRDLLAEDDIRFGRNSYRGDAFDKELRLYIKAWSDGWTVDNGYPDPSTLTIEETGE